MSHCVTLGGPMIFSKTISAYFPKVSLLMKNQWQFRLLEKNKILNKAQKFRESSTITTKLAQLASDVRSAEYLRRMEVLKTLALHWENGHEVSIHELSRGKVVAVSFYISNIIPRARRKP